jgi:light-regulated signal transduction histidine kinase (bacteriophytochrome)
MVCVFVSVCVFSDWVFADHLVSLPYLVLPPLLWVAYRFGVAGATVTVAVVAGIAIMGTVDQHGVFGTGPSHSALLTLQIFIGVIAVTTLLLGAASAERLRYAMALARANHRLRERTRQLEYVNRELESFSYSVSHDLRAPLRAIDGFAAILSDESGNKLDEQGKDYLRRIRVAAQHMGKLIDNMLQLARIGRARLRKERVDVTAMANSIITELRQANHHRQCRFECDAGLSMCADADALQLVFQNLIGNAWKYTAPRDDAWIHVGSRQEDGKTIYFVEDNGVGFDMRYVDRLFVPFQRLHGAEFEGTGIGLATVARIIGRHGGQCWATGEVGKGACFCFTFGADGEKS